MTDEEMTEFKELLKRMFPGSDVDAAGLADRLRDIHMDALLDVEELDGAQMRRIAELAELLWDDATARVWWEKAAQAGDRDAVDMVQILDDEREGLVDPSADSVAEAREVLERLVRQLWERRDTR